MVFWSRWIKISYLREKNTTLFGAHSRNAICTVHVDNFSFKSQPLSPLEGAARYSRMRHIMVYYAHEIPFRSGNVRLERLADSFERRVSSARTARSHHRGYPSYSCAARYRAVGGDQDPRQIRGTQRSHEHGRLSACNASHTRILH